MTECEHNRACRMAYGDEGCKPPCDLGLSCNLYEHKVDRDALLALAEDVDGAADDSGGFEPLAGMLRDIARRIREACGVTGDA